MTSVLVAEDDAVVLEITTRALERASRDVSAPPM